MSQKGNLFDSCNKDNEEEDNERKKSRPTSKRMQAGHILTIANFARHQTIVPTIGNPRCSASAGKPDWTEDTAAPCGAP